MRRYKTKKYRRYNQLKAPVLKPMKKYNYG